MSLYLVSSFSLVKLYIKANLKMIRPRSEPILQARHAHFFSFLFVLYDPLVWLQSQAQAALEPFIALPLCPRRAGTVGMATTSK